MAQCKTEKQNCARCAAIIWRKLQKFFSRNDFATAEYKKIALVLRKF